MNNKTTNTVGGNATPTPDALKDFLLEKKKPQSIQLSNAKKCVNLTVPGPYIGIPTKVATSGEQLLITFSIFDPADPNVRYRSARFWLNPEYTDGDPEDEFYKTFDNPESSDDIIGKSCEVEIELVKTLENSRIYPRIVGFSKLS